jgi:hypothetical protein
MVDVCCSAEKEGERFRQAYGATRLSWLRTLGLGIKLLMRSTAGGHR